jgi:hypothetical protein
MKKFIFLMLLVILGCDNTGSDIDKILIAKDRVRNMVNYPDTLSFHEFDTSVNGNTVTLKFTCKNGFGVPETHIMDIRVE